MSDFDTMAGDINQTITDVMGALMTHTSLAGTATEAVLVAIDEEAPQNATADDGQVRVRTARGLVKSEKLPEGSPTRGETLGDGTDTWIIDRWQPAGPGWLEVWLTASEPIEKSRRDFRLRR